MKRGPRLGGGVSLFALTLLGLAGVGLGVKSPVVRTGADQILDAPYRDWFAGKKIGLITNQTGVNDALESTADLLARVPDAKVAALFAPEHGLDGALQAGQPVPSELAVHSLYGPNRAPEPSSLEGLDLLVYDIQDVGTRHYTYPSTMLESMRAASAAGIPFVVLDRPDPLGGVTVEGPVMPEDLASFVGIAGLPARYAMTPGELARMLNRELNLNCDLKVVPLKGWRRGMSFDRTGLPWVPPSPNMPTLDTAYAYPGFCLIEGTNLSEGRGTTRPFELVGAPWLQNRELARRLNRLGLPGVAFRPQAFTPSFSKYSGQVCRGVQIHVTDRAVFRSFQTALVFLEEMSRLHPEQFRLERGFDRLAGDPRIRAHLEKGLPVADLPTSWTVGQAAFEKKRALAALYR